MQAKDYCLYDYAGIISEFFIPLKQYAIDDKGIKRRGFPRGAKLVDVRTEEKVHRNAPCPCGSGMKFKKCCKK